VKRWHDPRFAAELARRVGRGFVAATLVFTVALPALAAEPVALTRDGRFKLGPVFAGTGREVVYAELATPMLYRLMRLNANDGSIEAVHPDATTSELDPAFSADGKVFAFLKTVGTLRVNLEIHERSGAKLGEVPPGGGFSGMRSPAVSPDRQHVVYSFAEGGRQHLFQVRVDGSEKRTLTDSRGINNWPTYSHDGREIVFGSSRDGDFEIYRMPAGGGDAIRLTHTAGQDIRPKFSPDGKRIAFTSHRDGNAEIYVMNADGSSPQRITESPDRDDYPEWHPDGRQLVIVSERSGKFDLYLVALD
jgi:Tol biopolymer transport system component